MTPHEFLSQVAERAGFSGLEEAERTARTVLEVVGERLSGPALQALAEDLPAPLAASVLSGEHHQDFDLAELHARVSRRAEVRLGPAVEDTAVVCQVVAEAVSPGTLYRLHEALPEPMGALFTPRERGGHFEPVHHTPGRQTLAEGRPGSRHPVSETRPGSRHPVSEARPERAHRHSVAREDNPHGDTKLSSAAGLTQEREQETLATAHPESPSWPGAGS